MDQREIRLWQLTRALLANELTELERYEYGALHDEQAARIARAMLKLAAKQVRCVLKV